MFDGTLKFDTAIDKTGFELGLSSLGGLAKKGMAVVTGAVTAAGAGISALGVYATNVGKDFEGSMAQVIATMGVTKDTIQDGVNSYDLLKEAAAAAGESTTFSASEAADALNYLALAGYDAAKAADALPAVLNLAAAGGMELAYASDLATDAMAALGIEATSQNLTRFGDEMAKTASKANTSVSQLGEAILTVGGTAKSLAGGTTELNAALGVLANRGIKGSEGGTALRNMILALSAPTDKAATALEGLGVSAFDADGNLRPLNETFKDLDGALSGMSEGEKAQVLNEIFNKVDLKSAQAMLAGCGDEFDDLTTALEGCDGAMADMAHTMNDTLEGDIKSLQSKAEAFGIAIYENLNDPLRDLAQLGGDSISQLASAFKEGGFEGLADSLGGVLANAVAEISGYVPKIATIAVSVVTSLISGLRENLPAIADAALEAATTLVYGIASAAGELLKLGGVLIKTLVSGIAEHIPDVAAALQGLLKEIPEIFSNEALSEIAGAAVALVTALATGISETLPVLLDAALGLISALGNAILDSIPAILPVFYELAQSIISFLADGIPKVLEVAEQLITKGVTEILPQVVTIIGTQMPKVIEAISKALPQIERAIAKILPELVKSIVSAAPTIAQAITDVMPGVIEAAVDSMNEMFPAVHEAVVALITSLADLLPVIQETCYEVMPQLYGALADIIIDIAPDLLHLAIGLTTSIIKSTGEIVISLVWNLLNTIGQTLLGIGDILSDALIKGKETASNGVQKIISNVVEWVGSLPARFGEILGNVIGEVAKWAVEAPERARNAAKEFLNGVIEFIKSLPTNLGKLLGETVDKVKEWGPELVSRGKEAALDLVSTIGKIIAELPSKMAEAGGNLVRGLWNGITGMGSWIQDKISDFGSGIISGFKESFGIASPSKVMRDQVGIYLAEGIGVGFTEELARVGKDVVLAMDELTDDLRVDIDLPDDDRKPPRVPRIDSTAYQALGGLGALDRNIAPTSTAEIINNYSYSTTSTTTNNSTAPESVPTNITLNATFKVGEEVVAEGVVDIAADKIDERQGVTVELKKRGLAR
ncbi:MAG: phage tail tape measure protein [Ruminococcus sp.]|nr:phage tail tape measure protein [Ruminococcus sp.]